MKFLKLLFLAILGFNLSVIVKCQSVNVQINFSREELTISERDSSILLYRPYYIILPHGAEVINLHAFIKETELIADKMHYVSIKQREKNEPDNSANKQINFGINTESLPHSIPETNNIIELELPELQAGYLILKLFICPYQYYPDLNRLDLLKHVEINIRYIINKQEYDYETSEKNIEISKQYIRKTVLNPHDVENIVPLKEKIDYSKIKMFDEIDDNEQLRNNENVLTPDKKPYHIKKIK